MPEHGPTCTNDDLELRQARGMRRKLLIGGLVIVAALAYLIGSSFGGSAAYYLTVGELQAQGAAEDRQVRVSGQVVEGSVAYDPQNLLLTFQLADPTGALPVAYKGVRPDMFQEGAEAVVEGRYLADGRFQAANLLLKCPSKYEEAETR